MRGRFLCSTLAFIGMNFLGVHSTMAYTPTAEYVKRAMDGFTVLINPELLRHALEAQEAFKEFDTQAKAIARAVPRKPLASLHKVRIWMEWEQVKGGGAQFHPSADWLKANGYNPDKAGCVELSNALNFVHWSRKEQPCMLLHELAHSYHFLVLGEEYAGIQAAYKNAMDTKIYDSVDYVDGGKQKAYATTNAKEYFAEISEAYFGKNDFYPFTHDELKTYDPMGYQLLLKVWGPVGGDKSK